MGKKTQNTTKSYLADLGWSLEERCPTEDPKQPRIPVLKKIYGMRSTICSPMNFSRMPNNMPQLPPGSRPIVSNYGATFSRERLRRVLRKKHLQNTSSHLHLCTFTFSPISLLICTSTSLLICSSAHLHLSSSSHPHIYISPHLHILTPTSLLMFTSAHVHLCSCSHLRTTLLN